MKVDLCIQISFSLSLSCIERERGGGGLVARGGIVVAKEGVIVAASLRNNSLVQCLI